MSHMFKAYSVLTIVWSASLATHKLIMVRSFCQLFAMIGASINHHKHIVDLYGSKKPLHVRVDGNHQNGAPILFLPEV